MGYITYYHVVNRIDLHADDPRYSTDFGCMYDRSTGTVKAYRGEHSLTLDKNDRDSMKVLGPDWSPKDHRFLNSLFRELF